MASNSIIQCTSSSSHAIKKYDVFVSFRGEDTRNNFTDFLFEALRRNSLEAFKDTEDLNKGESIAPELLQAIQGSRIFLVVFSKNYASSTWCLRELVEICNCIETSPRQLLPIFYDVDPSQVRKQSGCYEQAFSKHQENFKEDKAKMEEVLRWRKTLSTVADFSGWDIGNKPQYAEIEKIAQSIKQKLGSKFSCLPKDNLVGMESRVEELERLLHLESDNDVRFVGISGMGGVGKTTLARAFYERFSHRYSVRCFIEHVSHTYRKDCGALSVQQQLLSQSSKEKSIEIRDICEGTLRVFDRLHTKGLIIFDDVDQFEQLNIFSGSRGITMLRECLGGGSRVIIVSRDEQILKIHGADDVYKVEPLNREDAIQLFCRKAFKRDSIISDYEEVTHAILSYVEGHPLTIEVIGSSLFGKNISQWRSTLAKLRNNQSEDIMDKLRIGFDELNSTNKEIFLDIACLFPYHKEEYYVKEILDIRGFYPDSGLQDLIDKSLITIDGNDEVHLIDMHNLLRDLGQYIVREKSPNQPSKWSRLWDRQDLCNVMSDNMEETNTEAMIIDPYESDKTMIFNALSKMRNLKLLIANTNKYSGSLNDLSNELGYLEYEEFPLECLPLSFQPHKLVMLVLYRSKIKQLWKGTKALPKLRSLILSYSENLIKMQNLGEAINLEILNLEGCIRLKQIDSSFGFPKNLTILNLKDCRSLVNLPHFGEALNLESINLQGCIQLKQIDSPFGFPKNLTTLNFKDCRSLINLPHFRDALNLEYIDLQGCTKLREIDSSIGFLGKLYFLNLSYCKSLVSLPNSILELNSLKYLSLFGCSTLYPNQLLEPKDAEYSKKLCTGEAPSHSQSMPSIIKMCFTLAVNCFSSLDSREQNESVNLFSSLDSREQYGSVDWFLHSSSIFPCMVRLDLSFCNLLQVPNAIGNLHSLEWLSLRGNNFAVMPSLKELSKLFHLNLQHCKRLEYLPELPSRIDFSISTGNSQLSRTIDDFCYGLNTFNCPQLAKREGCNMCFPWIMQTLKAQYEYRLMPGYREFSSIIPGSEIPSWFREQVCTDNSMRIDKNRAMHGSDWICIAFSAIFVARNQRAMDPPEEELPFSRFIPLLFREDIVTSESDHLWLFVLSRSSFEYYRPKLSDNELVLKIAGCGGGYDVEVRKYGYLFLYEEDLQLSNFTMMPSETSAIQEIE